MRILRFPDFLWPFNSRKRRLYHQSRVDFYEGRNALASNSSFDSLLNFNHLDALNTEKDIRFYGLLFGQTFKETIKKVGKPNYIDKRNLVLKNQKTIYYRLAIKGVKCILQMHFNKDQFFFGKMEIRQSNPSLKQDISQLVCQKYGINEPNWTGSIIDENNNQIILKENIVPNVCYIAGNPSLINEIKAELNLNKAERKYRQVEQSGLMLDVA